MKTYRSSWKDAMEDALEEEPEEASRRQCINVAHPVWLTEPNVLKPVRAFKHTFDH